MQYVSLDIETTGLDPFHHQVIEIAAIIDDTELPFADAMAFRTLVLPDGDPFGFKISGDLTALVMNAELLRELKDGKDNPKKVLSTTTACRELVKFFNGHLGVGTKIQFAGKNFGSFDLWFLKRWPEWSHIKHHHRFLDVGSMYANSRDVAVPDTAECLRRAGLEPSVKHRAYDDAYDVCRLIRAKWGVPL